MKEEEIRRAAEERAREQVTLSDKAYLKSFGQKYVKLIADRGKAGEVELRKAWVARFVDDERYRGAWVEIVLDDDGQVLRVNQSR
jgi:hypothetical protein